MAQTLEEITKAVEKALAAQRPTSPSGVRAATARLGKLAQAVSQGDAKPADVAKELRAIAAALGATGAPTRKAMTLPALVNHVVVELQKAAGEEPAIAKARLACVGAAVAKASEVLKQSFVDVDSEQIQVDVFQEDTTEVADRSDQTGNVVAIDAAPAASGFASNPEDLTSALEKLTAQLAALKGAKRPDKAPSEEAEKGAKAGKGKKGDDGEEEAEAEKARGKKDKEDHEEEGKTEKREPTWPLDLATEEFREGVTKQHLDWGHDPWAEE